MYIQVSRAPARGEGPTGRTPQADKPATLPSQFQDLLGHHGTSPFILLAVFANLGSFVHNARMHIVHVTPEMTPFAKVGGLGDAVGSLPRPKPAMAIR